MSKLVFNYDSLRYSCVQNIDSTISKLDKVINIFNNTSIPYDYSRRQEVINVGESIKNRRKELDEIREWITNSNNDYNSFINDSVDNLKSLPNSKFGIRKSI